MDITSPTYGQMTKTVPIISAAPDAVENYKKINR